MSRESVQSYSLRVGGAATSGGRTKTEILAIGDREIASAMGSASGEEVFLRMLKCNKETIRQMLRDWDGSAALYSKNVHSTLERY